MRYNFLSSNNEGLLKKIAGSLLVIMAFSTLFSPTLKAFSLIGSVGIMLLLSKKIDLFRIYLHHPIARAASLLYLAFIVGAMYGNAPFMERMHILRIYAPLLYMGCLLPLFKDAPWRDKLMSSFIYGVTLLSLLGIVNALGWVDFIKLFHLSTIGTRPEYPFGTFSFPISLATYFALQKTYSNRSLHGIYAACFLWLSFFIIFVSHERTAYILYALLISLYCYQHFGKKQIWIATLSLLLLGVTVYHTSSVLQKRTLQAKNDVVAYYAGDPLSSTGLRMLFAVNSYTLWKEHPWFGYGTGGFVHSYTTLKSYNAFGKLATLKAPLDQPHNEYAYIAVQLGVLGLGVFLYLLFTQLFLARALPLFERECAQALVLSFMTGCLDNTLLFYSSGVYYMLFSAVMYAPLAFKKKTRGRDTKHIHPQHLLISRTDNIGDVVLTLPIATFLKRRNPLLKIDFLCRRYAAPIARACSAIDTVIELETLEDPKTYLTQLNIDTILFCKPDKRLAYAAKKAKIQNRIGTQRRYFNWFSCNRWVYLRKKNSPLHEAQLNFKLLRPLGIDYIPDRKEIPGLYGITPPLRENITKRLSQTQFNIILHPKSNGHGREWPITHYSHLARLLCSYPDIHLWVTGSQEEGAWIELHAPELIKMPHVTSVCGQWTLEELTAFIYKADGLVASGTGPLHIAAALGKPTLGLFPPCPPIHPERWAPLGTQAQFLCQASSCSKCIKATTCVCMDKITPIAVTDIILQWKTRMR